MSTPVSIEPRLPLELLLLIFEHSLTPKAQLDYSTIPQNQTTLNTWSLVCRTFLPLAQSKLFATPCLSRPKQLDLLVRALDESPRGVELSALVRELRLGGPRKWIQALEPIVSLSEQVKVLLARCASLSVVCVWGARFGLEINALADATGLERLHLIQTPLVRTTNTPALPSSFSLPALRRLDGYVYSHSTDMVLFHPDVLPKLTSLSIDLGDLPAGQEAILHQLEHVSTSDWAPCGATFPQCKVYDCWETAYSMGRAVILGVVTPLPPKMRFLRIRADRGRGGPGERYDPARTIKYLLEHLDSAPCELKELRVPGAWMEGGRRWRDLEEWCKGKKVVLVREELNALQAGLDWWADEAFWELCDRAEEEDRRTLEEAETEEER